MDGYFGVWVLKNKYTLIGCAVNINRAFHTFSQYIFPCVISLKVASCCTAGGDYVTTLWTLTVTSRVLRRPHSAHWCNDWQKWLLPFLQIKLPLHQHYVIITTFQAWLGLVWILLAANNEHEAGAEAKSNDLTAQFWWSMKRRKPNLRPFLINHIPVYESLTDFRVKLIALQLEWIIALGIHWILFSCKL